jgi:hypothetical protein
MKSPKSSRKKNRVTPRKSLKSYRRSIRRSRKKDKKDVKVKSVKRVKFQEPLTEYNQPECNQCK